MKGDRLQGAKTLQVAGFLDEFAKDEIKSKVDILSLFADYGVALQKKGTSYMGLCPFHDDANPSLSVDPAKGLYHCFGCGESGDVVTLVQKVEGLGFTEALERLKGKTTGKPKKVNGSRTKVEPSNLKPQLESKLKLDDVQRRYEKDLVSHADAKGYLSSRGLGDVELIRRFGLGVGSGKLAGQLSQTQRRQAADLGILTSSGSEFFRGYLTVPLYDPHGQVVGMYGRALNDKAKVKHKYLPGPLRGLVNAKAASVYRDSLILTESILDALSLVALGIENVIPLYGVHGFTDDHLTALKEARVDRVILAFDDDAAGHEGSDALTDRLGTEGFEVKSIFPRGAKDWNQALVNGATKDEVTTLVASLASAADDKAPSEGPEIHKQGAKYVFESNSLSYRILGVKDLFSSSLRVNIRLTSKASSFLDNLDLYSARSRALFSNQCADLFCLDAALVEKDLLYLVDHLEAERDKALSPSEPVVPELKPEDREMGMALLTDPDLCERIVEDATTLGYVGEAVNKQLVYLAATSRKMDDPVSVIVSSQSASGKSYLIDTIAKLMPPEDVVSMTSLSDQALNYLPEDGLLHKFLVMGEAVHSEAIEHQIREMLSAKELSRLVTVKDPKTGELSARMVKKRVVVSAVMSTTDSRINPENASRSFLVHTDESEEQTKLIHESQRRKYSIENFERKETQIPRIVAAHHAAGRLLEKRKVVNAFASLVDFPHKAMRTRRDHERFMDLIAAVCFLRQFQKEEKVAGLHTFVEADWKDYEIAYRIMCQVLPATLTTFPQSAHDLYEAMREVIREKAKDASLQFSEVVVTQRELREATDFSQMFVKRNLKTLCDYEYVVTTGGTARGMRRGYKILQDEDLRLVDLDTIPSPQRIKALMKAQGTGKSGANRVKSGSAPLLKG